MLTFLEKKSKMTVPGMSIFWEYMKKHFKSNFFLAVVFVLESKGLSFSTGQLSGPTFTEGFMLDCKTVRIFAYSSTREQSNKRSGMRLKTESETGERR